MKLLLNMVTITYFAAALSLMCYGLNCYLMIALFKRRRKQALGSSRELLSKHEDLLERDHLPPVTTQIPLFNEYNVAERVMRAVALMHYPKARHEIQVLDDSNDETRELVDRVAAELKAEGYDIRVMRREQRTGYKAGALAHGLAQARGELIAVFDADFAPPPEFWQLTIPHFLEDDQLGLVQARWGHLNRRHSLLTRAQSIGIDGHFIVEQGARAWNGLFMNFNGTCGVWRKRAIEAAGGWEWDTLTEDMDLSYRMQLAGWGVRYLPELVVPGEIPEDVNAFKSQQFRWAKGSIQTARKILPRLLRAPVGRFRKLQAFFHLTHYCVHPLMLTLSLLALPVLVNLDITIGPLVFGLLATCLLLAMTAPSALYLVSQRAAYPDWGRRILILPALVVVGVGIALSNTRAVAEALAGVESGFIRTPKSGDTEKKRYRIALPWLGLAECGLGLYCAYSLHHYLLQAKYLVGPFLAIYAAGFLYIGALTLAHALGFGQRGKQAVSTKAGA